MKALLEFNLPEDQEQFTEAVNGTKWSCAVWEYDQYLRTQIKYNDNLSDDEHKAFEQAREKLYEIMNENNLSIK